uniref:Hepatitis A virus cellular receptor 1 homolog n=1 Tax=Paramormyrops kingsleyae TaxID=1676925 RepID=A0A3B3SA95_9TELE|nr:uncharacterized protein LOC111855161 isoform X1 [Paramormyrops kingsleyae]
MDGSLVRDYSPSMALLLAKTHALFLLHYCFTFSLGVGCSAALELVVGYAGDQVTLHCKYSVETHGVASACWGRGSVPLFKCRDTIVSTDGAKVTFRTSARYQLRNGMEGGDVSLTIVNITEQDSGNYGCRVEIPGLFNDEKYNFHLLVSDARRWHLHRKHDTDYGNNSHFSINPLHYYRFKVFQEMPVQQRHTGRCSAHCVTQITTDPRLGKQLWKATKTETNK